MCEHTACGHVELNEPCVDLRRIESKLGPGVGGKAIVFGIRKRHGKVYAEVVENCSNATSLAVIRARLDLRSVRHADGFGSYDGLADMSTRSIGVSIRHVGVLRQSHTLQPHQRHRGLPGNAKTCLARFRGIDSHTFIPPQSVRVPPEPPP